MYDLRRRTEIAEPGESGLARGDGGRSGVECDGLPQGLELRHAVGRRDIHRPFKVIL